jgi:transcriptional regulator with XRE-family HTH domain
MSRDGVDDAAEGDYAKALGVRLRAVRTQQHLSLQGVERRSGGRWKAVVVGSYERGDRSISVERLAQLADFYGVSMSELLPRGHGRAMEGGSGAAPLTRVVLNLSRLDALRDPDAGQLARFVRAIQHRRGTLGGTALAIRRDDMRTLALLYDMSEDNVTERLVHWQVLAPESLILDSQP